MTYQEEEVLEGVPGEQMVVGLPIEAIGLHLSMSRCRTNEE